MTGYLTDFGSLTGGWLRAQCSSGREQIPSLKRPFFFCLSILAFTGGGYAAKQSWDQHGILAALVPAALMAVTSLGVLPLAPVQEKMA